MVKPEADPYKGAPRVDTNAVFLDRLDNHMSVVGAGLQEDESVASIRLVLQVDVTIAR